MMATENSTLLVSEYEQKWIDGLNSGNVSVADEVFHPDCVIHINGNPQRDLPLDNFKQMINGLLGAFQICILQFMINLLQMEKLAPDGLLKEQTLDLSVKCKLQAKQLKLKGKLLTM